MRILTSYVLLLRFSLQLRLFGGGERGLGRGGGSSGLLPLLLLQEALGRGHLVGEGFRQTLLKITLEK
jgi:hypothetical protein